MEPFYQTSRRSIHTIIYNFLKTLLLIQICRKKSVDLLSKTSGALFARICFPCNGHMCRDILCCCSRVLIRRASNCGDSHLGRRPEIDSGRLDLNTDKKFENT